MPYFIDKRGLPFVKIIEDAYPVIKDELSAYLLTHELPSYFNTTMVQHKNSWKTISLNSWNINIYENYRYFPKTVEIIKTVPEIVSSSFSMLAPNSKIVPHCGDTNGIYRCHLGLSIPAAMPHCGFRVGNEWQSWEEGKILTFVDANNHEAINLTEHNRFIFLFDVIRPEFLNKKKLICATVRTSLFLQRRAEMFTVLYKIPLAFQKLLARCLVPAAIVAIPLRNLLYKHRA
jgi:ornithine lipid ester-linked acyl 2-hydroxylase